MNFMSIYANIYNWTRGISKIFLIYLSVRKSGACTFPIVKPVLDDANARKAIKAMIANQKG